MVPPFAPMAILLKKVPININIDPIIALMYCSYFRIKNKYEERYRVSKIFAYFRKL
ncbi:hypothetical protein GCM10008905_25760 [Clostridium malenominatum]|uniref:Uncharacterized protein n=1 Tax=Clostridium malenominatum TaxID=1539 RepID=A0ABN1J3L9_9CLOT